jgi:hypothetical protein
MPLEQLEQQFSFSPPQPLFPSFSSLPPPSFSFLPLPSLFPSSSSLTLQVISISKVAFPILSIIS